MNIKNIRIYTDTYPTFLMEKIINFVCMLYNIDDMSV